MTVTRNSLILARLKTAELLHRARHGESRPPAERVMRALADAIANANGHAQWLELNGYTREAAELRGTVAEWAEAYRSNR
ncbi:hypothetical protein [Burkholderia sp. MBR-1]|uniref:hypothetical protein n=1 Tax=Burkholderia sp. MBR-1 TaxID=2732364 RepID=UPI0015EEEEAC|nr:hypothetical protein [Burkholderia sp. MBR-1]QMI49682.1 hypothetical protein MBR110_29805 [Burkholderia sp. MBR-1]